MSFRNRPVIFNKNPIDEVESFATFATISPTAERLRKASLSARGFFVLAGIASVFNAGKATGVIDYDVSLPDALDFVQHPIVAGVLSVAIGALAISEHSRANILEHASAIQLVQDSTALSQIPAPRNH